MLDSRVAPQVRADVLATDREHKRLLAAAAATGIEQRLKAAKRGWYALSPGWVDERKQEVHFFLNPMEQPRYNHGWFTVAELDAWAAGHGPVMKSDQVGAKAG